MINPYCNSLKGFFSDMVYYGILKDEDAQCFKTDVQVKPTFYLLFSGAIVLALINSFVMKAVSQYFRDCTTSPLEVLHNMQREKVANFIDIGDIENVDRDEPLEVGKIHPVPVLFTDQYRWFLQREDTSFQNSDSFDNSDGIKDSDSFGDSDGMKEPSYADSTQFTEDVGPNHTRNTLYVENGRKIIGLEEQSFDDASIYTYNTDPK